MKMQPKTVAPVLALSALLAQGCQPTHEVISRLPLDVNAVTDTLSSLEPKQNIQKQVTEELQFIDTKINEAFGVKLGDKLDLSQCLERSVENECKISTQGNDYFNTAVVVYVPSTMQVAEIAAIHSNSVGEDTKTRPPFKHYLHGSVTWGHGFISACKAQAKFAKEGLASKGIPDSAFKPVKFNEGKLAHQFLLLEGDKHRLQLYCHPGDLSYSSTRDTKVSHNEYVRSVQYVFSYIDNQLKDQLDTELRQKEEMAKQKAEALEELKRQKRAEELKRKASSAF